MSTTRLRLSKLHGAGNDFLVTIAPEGGAPDAALATRVCDRHRGIGADGLITVLPGRDGADCTMELRNADGGLAEMSGNGIGCLSWVAVREGLGDGVLVGEELVQRTDRRLRAARDGAHRRRLPSRLRELADRGVEQARDPLLPAVLARFAPRAAVEM